MWLRSVAGGAGGEGLAATSHRQLLDVTTEVTSVGGKEGYETFPSQSHIFLQQIYQLQTCVCVHFDETLWVELDEIAIFVVRGVNVSNFMRGNPVLFWVCQMPNH